MFVYIYLHAYNVFTDHFFSCSSDLSLSIIFHLVEILWKFISWRYLVVNYLWNNFLLLSFLRLVRVRRTLLTIWLSFFHFQRKLVTAQKEYLIFPGSLLPARYKYDFLAWYWRCLLFCPDFLLSGIHHMSCCSVGTLCNRGVGFLTVPQCPCTWAYVILPRQDVLPNLSTWSTLYLLFIKFYSLSRPKLNAIFAMEPFPTTLAIRYLFLPFIPLTPVDST